MHRLPVSCKSLRYNTWVRLNSSSSFIRNTFIDYFVKEHGHKHVKSSAVVPLCDPTVPFVNAGMHQFKGVFLGKVEPPCSRAVNSQKCIRVGGKHNDLDVVGSDGHHHTFFEMLGNWSFGDYYKKEACQMAWDLLLGPYRLKPENLVVTYFAGDAVIGLTEDRECRDAWLKIGVPKDRLRALNAADNFWEMGGVGPCGPCTEIHYVNQDGSLTEIWNLVFIHCNREADGKVQGLRRRHVDTGMGLERMAAILQGVPSNYDTDLFRPIIAAIQKNSKGVVPYGGSYDSEAVLDCAYRRLADHARMISVCLADAVFPATSLNLKQILRKSLKISTDVFHNPKLLLTLYDEVASTLGSTYPELVAREKDAKLILEYEADSYKKMRASLAKKWKGLVKQYPEVEALSDLELPGFALGYKEFKETMSNKNTNVIPGELVFKLYDTHGFQEDIIDRIAQLNSLQIDRTGFWKLLSDHKSKHKTAFKEQANNKGILFDSAVTTLVKDGAKPTNDQFKYDFQVVDNKVTFEPLKTNLTAILNEEIDTIDFLDPCEDNPYYLVTEDTNFYCEEGGQISDCGVIRIKEGVDFNVETVFKIRDFVFHKGYFSIGEVKGNKHVKCGLNVSLEINSERRLKIMKNHTAVHLLNAAVRKVLPNSVVWQIGSNVTDRGLYLNLSVYGQKLSQEVVLEAQDLIRQSIQANTPLNTRVIDNVELTNEASVVCVPGETYPETGIRLVAIPSPLVSKELCCGTHVPSTGVVDEFCVTLVKGAGGHTPTVHALAGDNAREARELFCRAEKLHQVIDLLDPDRKKEEIEMIRRDLGAVCVGSGAPYGEYAQCLALLENMEKREVNKNDMALQAVAEEEIREASLETSREGRPFLVHFLRCSYLMQGEGVSRVLAACPMEPPAMVLGCAGGVIVAACRVPESVVTESFTAERWLRCVVPVFKADVMPTDTPLTYAQMTATKVSLINCEQLVQDAMRIAIKFAQSHIKETLTDGEPSKDRRQN